MEPIFEPYQSVLEIYAQHKNERISYIKKLTQATTIPSIFLIPEQEEESNLFFENRISFI